MLYSDYVESRLKESFEDYERCFSSDNKSNCPSILRDILDVLYENSGPQQSKMVLQKAQNVWRDLVDEIRGPIVHIGPYSENQILAQKELFDFIVENVRAETRKE